MTEACLSDYCVDSIKLWPFGALFKRLALWRWGRIPDVNFTLDISTLTTMCLQYVDFVDFTMGCTHLLRSSKWWLYRGLVPHVNSVPKLSHTVPSVSNSCMLPWRGGGIQRQFACSLHDYYPRVPRHQTDAAVCQRQEQENPPCPAPGKGRGRSILAWMDVKGSTSWSSSYGFVLITAQRLTLKKDTGNVGNPHLAPPPPHHPHLFFSDLC